MVVQPNFYLLCVTPSVAARRKLPEVAVYECYAGKANNVHPVFPSTVYHLDITRKRIVTIQCHDTGKSFTKRTKCSTIV
jgi:hypothetical protein